jgi:signal transduction histidine kinase
MKSGFWQRLKRLSVLLAVTHPESAESAQRIVALQRNVVLPARVLAVAGVLYHLYSSPWLRSVVDTYGVVFETIENIFAAYAMLVAATTALFFVVRRFPPGIVQWIVFIIGLGDGVFLGGLTVLTGGFESNLYWVYPAVIVINAISIPLATPQIVLNLVLSIFFLLAVLIESSVNLEPNQSGSLYKPTQKISVDRIQDLPAIVAWLRHPPEPMPESLRVQLSESERAKLSPSLWDQLSEETRASLSAYLETGAGEAESKKALVKDLNRIVSPPRRFVVEAEPPEVTAGPYVARAAVLVLLTFCCYGVQVLAAGQQRAEEEQKEFLVRTEQLRGAGRLAAEFAHQIKNPLAIINNVTFSLQRALKDTKPESAQQIEIIREEVAKADRIITQIMGYAQLAEGRIEKLSVTQELDRVIQEVFPAGVPSDIHVQRQYDDSFPPLLMQRRHFAESVANLLQNAREAAAKKGEILVRARCLSDYSVEVTVRDNGPGIPPDKLERIFEAYYTTKERGTGLGLAIVKHNAELYGGSVRVQSELGKGAQFTLLFPAKTLIKLARQT